MANRISITKVELSEGLIDDRNVSRCQEILLSDLPPQHNWHADCAEVVRSNLIIRRHIPIALPSAVIDAVDQDGIGRFVPAEQAVAGSCGTANPG